MPVSSTLELGRTWVFVNNSTGALTINSSGGNAIATVAANTVAVVQCILLTGTSAASWDAKIAGFATSTGSGAVVRATSPTLVTPTLGVAAATSINFGGTALSVYAEGTFTPTIIGSSSAGTGTYSQQAGSYTKIGNFVFFALRVSITGHTGTGNMIIEGLPFTAFGRNMPVSLMVGSLTFSNNLAAYVSAGTTQIAFVTYSSGGAFGSLAMDTTSDFQIAGCYVV